MIGRRTSKLFNLHRSRNWTGLNGLVSNRRREREREEHHAGSVPKGKAIRGLRNNSSCLCGSPPLLSISISLSPSSSFLLFFFFFLSFSLPRRCSGWQKIFVSIGDRQTFYGLYPSLFAYRLTILLWKFRVEEARNIGPRFAL